MNTLVEKFDDWRRRNGRLIKPFPCLSILLFIYLVCYILNGLPDTREVLLLWGCGLVYLLFGFEWMVKKWAVANKEKVRKAFQREVSWDTEMQHTRKLLLEFMIPYMAWADDYTLTWADGRWIVWVRWTESDDFDTIAEKQVEGWPFFKHIICMDTMDSFAMRSFPSYSPQVRIMNYK